MDINAEVRRCLVTGDVHGLMRLRKPHEPELSPSEAMIALHIARVELKGLHRRLKDYSRAWLRERGYEIVAGRWVQVDPKDVPIFSEGVGIMSMRAPGVKLPFNRLIERGMSDALLNGMAKGITEPPMQIEVMQKERRRIRFKARRV